MSTILSPVQTTAQQASVEVVLFNRGENPVVTPNTVLEGKVVLRLPLPTAVARVKLHLRGSERVSSSLKVGLADVYTHKTAGRRLNGSAYATTNNSSNSSSKLTTNHSSSNGSQATSFLSSLWPIKSKNAANASNSNSGDSQKQQQQQQQPIVLERIFFSSETDIWIRSDDFAGATLPKGTHSFPFVCRFPNVNFPATSTSNPSIEIRYDMTAFALVSNLNQSNLVSPYRELVFCPIVPFSSQIARMPFTKTLPVFCDKDLAKLKSTPRRLMSLAARVYNAEFRSGDIIGLVLDVELENQRDNITSIEVKLMERVECTSATGISTMATLAEAKMIGPQMWSKESVLFEQKREFTVQEVTEAHTDLIFAFAKSKDPGLNKNYEFLIPIPPAQQIVTFDSAFLSHTYRLVVSVLVNQNGSYRSGKAELPLRPVSVLPLAHPVSSVRLEPPKHSTGGKVNSLSAAARRAAKRATIGNCTGASSLQSAISGLLLHSDNGDGSTGTVIFNTHIPENELTKPLSVFAVPWEQAQVAVMGQKNLEPSSPSLPLSPTSASFGSSFIGGVPSPLITTQASMDNRPTRRNAPVGPMLGISPRDSIDWKYLETKQLPTPSSASDEYSSAQLGISDLGGSIGTMNSNYHQTGKYGNSFYSGKSFASGTSGVGAFVNTVFVTPSNSNSAQSSSSPMVDEDFDDMKNVLMLLPAPPSFDRSAKPSELSPPLSPTASASYKRGPYMSPPQQPLSQQPQLYYEEHKPYHASPQQYPQIFQRQYQQPGHIQTETLAERLAHKPKSLSRTRSVGDNLLRQRQLYQQRQYPVGQNFQEPYQYQYQHQSQSQSQQQQSLSYHQQQSSVGASPLPALPQPPQNQQSAIFPATSTMNLQQQQRAYAQLQQLRAQYPQINYDIHHQVPYHTTVTANVPHGMI
ncbi:hypothetical protein GQ42DRAFT_179128 [Ramicandelaber brevisporus]|nr:hypothetical protein GQ42DRAFT_179128 [Ramicandelaber brevisporus]